jgi:hypothetical protein
MIHNSRYDQFPPAVNGCGTTHLVLENDPPLQVEEEGSPT